MEQLQGRKALITGGSRGLGKATALALAAEGVDIAITGRNEEALLETIAELQAYGVKAIYSVFDVADFEAAKKESPISMKHLVLLIYLSIMQEQLLLEVFGNGTGKMAGNPKRQCYGYL